MRQGDLLRVRIDEPPPVAARDRGHRDALARGGPGLLERRPFRKLERVEPERSGGVVFLAKGRARDEPVLDAKPHPTVTQVPRRALSSAAAAKRTCREPSSNVGSATADGFPSIAP